MNLFMRVALATHVAMIVGPTMGSSQSPANPQAGDVWTSEQIIAAEEKLESYTPWSPERRSAAQEVIRKGREAWVACYMAIAAEDNQAQPPGVLLNFLDPFLCTVPDC